MWVAEVISLSITRNALHFRIARNPSRQTVFAITTCFQALHVYEITSCESSKSRNHLNECRHWNECRAEAIFKLQDALRLLWNHKTLPKAHPRKKRREMFQIFVFVNENFTHDLEACADDVSPRLPILGLPIFSRTHKRQWKIDFKVDTVPSNFLSQLAIF